MNTRKNISRRDFLKAASLASAGAILAACAAPATPTAAPQPTAQPTVAGADAERTKWLTGKVPADTAIKMEIFTWDPSGSDRTLVLDVDRFFKTFYPKSSYSTGTSAPWDDYWTKLPTIMAAGTPPDLAFIHFSRVPAFALKGWAIPLDDYIAAKPPDGWPDLWWKSAVDMMAYKGKQYAIPWDWAPIAISLNRDVVDPIVGKYPPSDDWTWKDYYEIAKAAVGETNGKKRFGMDIRTYDLGMWGITADFGGTFFNADVTKATFSMPETVAAFQYVWDAIFKDKIAPTSVDQQAFGDVGGFPSGLEATTYIGYDAPIGYKDSVKTFKWGVAGLPKGPAGRHAFEGNVGWFVPKGSRYPDMAYELCAYFHGNPELARARAVANSQMVARKDQCHWAYEQFKDTVPNIEHAIIDLGGENQDHFPVFPGYQEWGAIWTKWIDPLFVEGNPDVKGQLAGLEKETNDFLANGWWNKS